MSFTRDQLIAMERRVDELQDIVEEAGGRTHDPREFCPEDWWAMILKDLERSVGILLDNLDIEEEQDGKISDEIYAAVGTLGLEKGLDSVRLRTEERELWRARLKREGF
jgi:hypothetical protein